MEKRNYTRFDQNDGVAAITLDRDDKLNAFNTALIAEVNGSFPTCESRWRFRPVPTGSRFLVATLAVDNRFQPFIDEGRFDTLGQSDDVGRHLVFGNHDKTNAHLLERIARPAVNIGQVDDHMHDRSGCAAPGSLAPAG
jgi:hypothetical protein